VKSPVTVKRPGLTRQERRAAFGGTLKRLRRGEKPDHAGPIVLSWTRGGKQIIDYTTGATIDLPRFPRLWITLKGWHLKNGAWETLVTIHDRRDQNRVLASGLGGIPRESGLKTRWREAVDSEGRVRAKRVLRRDEQRENWTPETERGYGGKKGMERSTEGDLVPSTAVDDMTLAGFAQLAGEANLSLRDKRRREARQAELARVLEAGRRM